MSNNTNNKKTNSIEPTIIKIEALEQEYMVILKQYENQYKNYINSIKESESSETTDTSGNNFVALQGRTYWGQKGLKESSMQTVEECESMCASDTKCTGATFNTAKRYCWTRGGDGTLTIGNTDDYAIIPKIRKNLISLKNLNQKLLDINAKINTEITNIYPIAQQDVILKNKKQEELEKYYSLLLKEKIELEKTLEEYQTIEQQYENNFLNTVSQNTSLRLWTIFMLIILTVTIKKISGTNDTNSTVVFWAAIFILFILLSLNLTTAQGFAAWGLLILIIIFIKFTQMKI